MGATPQAWEIAEVEMGLIRNRVSELMGRERMKITDLMRITGLSYGTAWALYHDKTNGIDYETLAVLCETFDVQPGELLVYVPEREQKQKVVKEDAPVTGDG